MQVAELHEKDFLAWITLWKGQVLAEQHVDPRQQVRPIRNISNVNAPAVNDRLLPLPLVELDLAELVRLAKTAASGHLAVTVEAKHGKILAGVVRWIAIYVVELHILVRYTTDATSVVRSEEKLSLYILRNRKTLLRHVGSRRLAP
jgi:hypothetical protein